MKTLEFRIEEQYYHRRTRYHVYVKPNKVIKYNTPLLEDYVDDFEREVAICPTYSIAECFIASFQTEA